METLQANLHALRQALVVAVVPAVVLAGCSQSTPTQTTAPETTESQVGESTVVPEGLESTDSATQDGVQVVEVEGGSFYFKPNIIRVKKGEPVKIVLNSVDMMHDLVIDELKVKTEIIQSGETTEVEFTPDTAGEFEFYCSVGQHRANGMVGTLIVEE